MHVVSNDSESIDEDFFHFSYALTKEDGGCKHLKNHICSRKVMNNFYS